MPDEPLDDAQDGQPAQTGPGLQTEPDPTPDERGPEQPVDKPEA